MGVLPRHFRKVQHAKHFGEGFHLFDLNLFKNDDFFQLFSNEIRYFPIFWMQEMNLQCCNTALEFFHIWKMIFCIDNRRLNVALNESFLIFSNFFSRNLSIKNFYKLLNWISDNSITFSIFYRFLKWYFVSAIDDLNHLINLFPSEFDSLHNFWIGKLNDT